MPVSKEECSKTAEVRNDCAISGVLKTFRYYLTCFLNLFSSYQSSAQFLLEAKCFVSIDDSRFFCTMPYRGHFSKILKFFSLFFVLRGLRLRKTVFPILRVTSEYFQSCGTDESFLSNCAKAVRLSSTLSEFFRTFFGQWNPSLFTKFGSPKIVQLFVKKNWVYCCFQIGERGFRVLCLSIRIVFGTVISLNFNNSPEHISNFCAF